MLIKLNLFGWQGNSKRRCSKLPLPQALPHDVPQSYGASPLQHARDSALYKDAAPEPCAGPHRAYRDVGGSVCVTV